MAAVEVLQLPPAVARIDQVGWIVLSEDRQGLVEFILFDIAVCGKVPTRGASGNQVFAR